MELPQFNRLSAFPNSESKDGEIFYPNWNCFCCHDTGKVNSHRVRLIIPNFDSRTDKIPLCTNCNVHHNLTHLLDYEALDTRFTPEICAELDRIAREDWSNTAKSNQQSLLAEKAQQAAIELAQSRSLRKRDRTPHEDLLQQQKHQWKRENWDLEIKTEDPEKELENEYTG